MINDHVFNGAGVFQSGGLGFQEGPVLVTLTVHTDGSRATQAFR